MELGAALGAVSLEWRGAPGGRVLPRLLKVLGDLGGMRLLTGALGGTSVTSDLR